VLQSVKRINFADPRDTHETLRMYNLAKNDILKQMGMMCAKVTGSDTYFFPPNHPSYHAMDLDEEYYELL
jgi:hypothetical protein